MWDPNTVELWEMRSKFKARNIIQGVLCMSICVCWRSDEAVSSGREPCMDHQARDGRCSQGI